MNDKSNLEVELVQYVCVSIFGEKLEVKKIPESKRMTPDMHVPDKKLLVEVKRIDNPKNNKQSSMWARSIERLKQRLEAESGWSGEFYLTGTGEMHIPRSSIEGQRILDDAINKILPALKTLQMEENFENDSEEDESNEGCFIYIEGNVHFKIVKIADEGKGVWFDSMDFQMGFPETQTDEIKKNIEKADKQLSEHIQFYPDHEKWLILPIMDWNLWGRHEEIQKVIDHVPNDINRIYGINLNGGKVQSALFEFQNPAKK